MSARTKPHALPALKGFATSRLREFALSDLGAMG
jgi:hypothetical protein